MVTGKQKVKVQLLFKDTVILTPLQIDYINNHITELVQDSITKGNCVKLTFLEGLDEDDTCIVSGYEYDFLFMADVEGEYDYESMIPSNMNTTLSWNNTNKIEEIDENVLYSNLRKQLLLADFGEKIQKVFVKLYSIENPPSSSRLN
ncbi:MAG: hypothetical protein VZS44_09585 [Bacilli bacterium]|nr:hypothetical protein [Bacilli bacterium]